MIISGPLANFKKMKKLSHIPLVSCIMPTADRRLFVPQAIKYFLRQDYAKRELIIVDDGAEAVRDLVPDDESILYIRMDRKASLGAKRNLACEYARGEIIIDWDDDDWYAPHRVSYQVAALLEAGADLCGTNDLLFYDMIKERGWRYVYPSDRKLWLSGSTLCYTRACWAAQRFADVTLCEDVMFVWNPTPKRMIALPDPTFHMGAIHLHNASPKHTEGPNWYPHSIAHLRNLLGEDWKFYQSNPLR